MSTSRKNTKDTNQTNLEIAQMGNEYNMAMLDKQIQEQWKMWQAENEYNSASAQRARLEAAGLNPYLMMDGGNAGSASSMTAPAAQGAIVPTMALSSTYRVQNDVGNPAPTDTYYLHLDSLQQKQPVLRQYVHAHPSSRPRTDSLILSY